MTRLFSIYDLAAARIGATSGWLLPSLARLAFAAVLAGYFVTSGLTKFAGSPFTPSTGAYAQIFPRAFEAAGYDPDALTAFHHLVALIAGWAEIALPVLIVLGLLTRLAALGMIGFVVVQSLTDVFGHLAGPETLGALFDSAPDAAILDQRVLWVLLLAILVIKGAGPVSLDRLLR